MAALQPNDARFLLDFLLPQLKSEHAVTRRIFSALPLDGGSYRPSPKAMSAFELVRHIAICDLWFLDAIINGQFDDAAMPPATATTCQDVGAWYAENFSPRVERVQQLSGVELAREFDYIGLRHDPAVAYLNIAIRHTAHHRGQLSAYLRAMGARVPAIYVESADEPYPTDDGSIVVPPAF
ncbi:MAG: DinB family protein [Acidobacteria bacterium]|nr:DinB family protein [Acidobacteriota bacterium]